MLLRGLLSTSRRGAGSCLAAASPGAAAAAPGAPRAAARPALLPFGGVRQLCAPASPTAASKAGADARIEQQIASMAKVRDEQHGIGLVTRREEFVFPTLAATERSDEEAGSNACRRLRSAGRLPAVLYGSDTDGKAKPRDRVLCSVDRKAVEDAVRARGIGFENSVFELSVTRAGGKAPETHYVTCRDLQQCYVTDTLLAVNFLRFNNRRKYRLPVVTVAEDACVALKAGGWVNLWQPHIPCLVEEDWRMPRALELDLTGVYAKEPLTLENVTMPAGVVPALGERKEDNFTIGNVQGKGMAGKRPSKESVVVNLDFDEDYEEDEDDKAA